MYLHHKYATWMLFICLFRKLCRVFFFFVSKSSIRLNIDKHIMEEKTIYFICWIVYGRLKLSRQRGMYMQPSSMEKLQWRLDQVIMSHQVNPKDGTQSLRGGITRSGKHCNLITGIIYVSKCIYPIWISTMRLSFYLKSCWRMLNW